MRWQGRRQSDNVEDRRGMPAGRLAVGGGLGTVVVLLVVMLLGGDPQALLQQMQPPAGGPAADQAAGPQQVDPAEQPLRDFVAVVLADTEDVWNDLFAKQVGAKYREPKLVLYTGQVESACGSGSAAMGPFYCPGDEKVYLDLGFCQEMKTKYQAPGDFAVAYVSGARGRSPRAEAGRLHGLGRQAAGTGQQGRAEPSCRCVWSCRRTTWPASGPTTPRDRKRSWSRATWMKPSAPPAP